MADSGNIAYLATGKISQDFEAVTAFMGSAVADGVRLTTHPAEGSSATWLWASQPVAPGLLHIAFNPDVVASDTAVWFVWVDEPTANPRASNIVAFADGKVSPGTVMSQYQFAASGVANDQQVGAIRWHSETGLIHQIFVATDFRRQQLGTVLLYAASAIHQSRSWPGRIHADGRRTELGQQFAAGIRHPQRLRPQNEIMPAMDYSATDGKATDA